MTSTSGFQAINFDDLENFLDKEGNDTRGYILDEVTCSADGSVEAIADLPEYNGVVIYHSNPVLQFNAYTNITSQLEKDTSL